MDPHQQSRFKGRGALSIVEFCFWAGISRSHFYREVSCGRIKVRKIGRRSVVTVDDSLAWLRNLPVIGEAPAGEPQESRDKRLHTYEQSFSDDGGKTNRRSDRQTAGGQR